MFIKIKILQFLLIKYFTLFTYELFARVQLVYGEGKQMSSYLLLQCKTSLIKLYGEGKQISIYLFCNVKPI